MAKIGRQPSSNGFRLALRGSRKRRRPQVPQRPQVLQLPRATQVPHAGDASRGCRTSHVPQVPRAAGAAGARKSVRIRSPELRPGRIFVKRTREIRFLESRGRGGPNVGIWRSGGVGPMSATVYPAWRMGWVTKWVLVKNMVRLRSAGLYGGPSDADVRARPDVEGPGADVC